ITSSKRNLKKNGVTQTKKKINSPVVEKRNKEATEEQRTSTSRGTNNQQRNKEPAMAEEMRAKNQCCVCG
ncbi:hypothetical protein Godav_002929, partial [Gossypium davidsonii]|nr:hypothetical protein [Gossypium davidsonii]MBA0666585.1 hypothetical protein [Gossypium klotzschianum]